LRPLLAAITCGGWSSARSTRRGCYTRTSTPGWRTGFDTHERHEIAGRDFDDLTRRQYTDANVYLAEDVLTKTIG